jgi:hypothetical protein
VHQAEEDPPASSTGVASIECASPDKSRAPDRMGATVVFLGMVPIKPNVRFQWHQLRIAATGLPTVLASGTSLDSGCRLEPVGLGARGTSPVCRRRCRNPGTWIVGMHRASDAAASSHFAGALLAMGCSAVRAGMLVAVALPRLRICAHRTVLQRMRPLSPLDNQMSEQTEAIVVSIAPRPPLLAS